MQGKVRNTKDYINVSAMEVNGHTRLYMQASIAGTHAVAHMDRTGDNDPSLDAVRRRVEEFATSLLSK